jgi:hypothetical protein
VRTILESLVAAAFVIGMVAPASAQGTPPAQEDPAGLAKKLSNPISDLVSVPFQFNWEQGVGPDDQTRFILNVQPVIPFKVGEKTNLVMRVIVPFVSQPPLFPGGEPTGGVSDVLASFFVAPHTGSLIWGVGPVLSLPSTAEPALGTEKWSVGPTFVVLKQSGAATYGMLWNQVWSVSGNAERADVNQMFVQPFVAVTTAKALTLTLQSESTCNFEADHDKWTVPVNFIVSKVASFGPFPASYALGAGAFVEKPEGGPEWKLRAAVTLLLPNKK